MHIALVAGLYRRADTIAHCQKLTAHCLSNFITYLYYSHYEIQKHTYFQVAVFVVYPSECECLRACRATVD